MSAFYLQVWDSGFGTCLVVRLHSPLASAPAQASAKHSGVWVQRWRFAYSFHCSSFFWFDQLYAGNPENGTTMETIQVRFPDSDAVGLLGKKP